MSNENIIDDRIIASLRSLRPDRWNRWVEAGRRGEEQGRKLLRLIEASKRTPYYERLSHFVQVCLDKSGVSTDQASQVLGIDLRDSCLAMDEASISSLEAAHLLQLDRKYVREVLQLACLSTVIEPFSEPRPTGFVQRQTTEALDEDLVERQGDVSLAKSNFVSDKTGLGLDEISELRFSRQKYANSEDREKLKRCIQVLDAWESSAM